MRFPRWRVGLICSSMRNFLAGVIHRRFEVIEKFIQFIECELRSLCHGAICCQSLGQMSGQLGIFEDSAPLSF